MAVDRSNAGPKRDAALRALRLSKQPVPRAIAADLATNANNVTTDAPKVALEDTDLVALVNDDGRIQPVTLANLLAFLESRYVLTPIP